MSSDQTRRAFRLRHHQGVRGLECNGEVTITSPCSKACCSMQTGDEAARLEGRDITACRTFDELPENAKALR